MRDFAWAEMAPLTPDSPDTIVRIFKSKSAASRAGIKIERVIYTYAVRDIRYQLWLRCKGECELCASPVTEQNGHMHEQKHRGKGGEISLANSVFICPTCHGRAHKDRNTRFSKKHLTTNPDSGNLQPDSSTPEHRGS